MLDTTNWVSYPFEVNGVKFNSMLDPKGNYYSRVEKLPAGVFLQFNKEAIRDLIGDVSKLSRKEIEENLNQVNDGATQALICLA